MATTPENGHGGPRLLSQYQAHPHSDLLLAMPNELLDTICDQVYFDDILNLRLVCKQLQSKTECYFLRTFFTSKQCFLTCESLKPLRDMSGDERIASRLDHIGFGLGCFYREKGELVAGTCQAQPVRILAKVFRNLRDDPTRPRDRVLSICGPSVRTVPSRWASESSVERKVRTYDLGSLERSANTTDVFKAVLRALLVSEKAVQGLSSALKVSGSGLFDEAFLIEEALRNKAASTLPNLKMLNLQPTLRSVEYMFPGRAFGSKRYNMDRQFMTFLALTTNVTDLRLDLRDARQEAVDKLFASIAEAQANGSPILTRLQSLHLENVAAGPAALLHLLSSVCNVRRLKLKDVKLVDTDAAANSNLWADFFNELIGIQPSELMHLHDIQFGPRLKQMTGSTSPLRHPDDYAGEVLGRVWYPIGYPVEFLIKIQNSDEVDVSSLIKDTVEYQGGQVVTFLQELNMSVRVSEILLERATYGEYNSEDSDVSL